MTTQAQYIDRVLDNMPRATPLRSQIAMELESHIAERVQGGQSLDDVIRQLGDPVALAESYLTAVPLRAASFGRRAAAKVLDFLIVMCVVAPIEWIVWQASGAPFFPGLVVPYLVILMVVSTFGLMGYTLITEYRVGQTAGKRFLGVCVVRESGARISLGQSFLRQLPMFFQMYWVDVLFALFTEKSQRAFELVSKTRVVHTSEEAS